MATASRIMGALTLPQGKSSLLIVSRLGVLLIAAPLFLAACTSSNLTLKQEAFEVGTRYKVAQVAVVGIITNGSIPRDVRQLVQQSEQTARPSIDALLAYAEACGQSCERLSGYLAAGVAALHSVEPIIIEAGK